MVGLVADDWSGTTAQKPPSHKHKQDAAAGIAMAGERAPTTPPHPLQSLKKRSANSAFGEDLHDENLKKCSFCQRDASPHFICAVCTEIIQRGITLDTIVSAVHDLQSMDTDEDMFKDEPHIGSLEFCTTCCKFYMPDQFNDEGHSHLKLEKISDVWCILLPKNEAWTSMFKDVQELQAMENISWIPVEWSNVCCDVCGDKLHSEGIFCNFMCRIKRHPHLGWPSALLNEEFAVSCDPDIICTSYPPKKLCSHCCQQHHMGRGFQVLDPSWKDNVSSNCLLKHVSGEHIRCYAQCKRCSVKLSEKESRSHGCFRNVEMISSTSIQHAFVLVQLIFFIVLLPLCFCRFPSNNQNLLQNLSTTGMASAYFVHVALLIAYVNIMKSTSPFGLSTTTHVTHIVL